MGTGNRKEKPKILEAPEHSRRIRLYRMQMIGLPLMLALPVLSMLGVLSSEDRTRSARGGDLQLTVQYPSKLHYQEDAPLELLVANTSSRPLRDVELIVDASYLDQFDDREFNPPPRGSAFEFSFGEIGPGEAKMVVGSISGNRYWSHYGQVKARVGGQEVASVDIDTFVFP